MFNRKFGPNWIQVANTKSHVSCNVTFNNISVIWYRWWSVLLVEDTKEHHRPSRVMDPVIKTLTTGPMIPSGSNSPPVARVIGPVIETLTTGY
jgi:hypothetical protein